MAAQVQREAAKIASTESSLTITWSAPTSEGLSPVTGYVVTLTGTSKGCHTKATQCVVTGLRPNVQYSVVVIAVNADGTSVAVPVNAVPGSGTITLTGYTEKGAKPETLKLLGLARARAVASALTADLHAFHVPTPTITVASGGPSNFVGGNPDTSADRRVEWALSLPSA